MRGSISPIWAAPTSCARRWAGRGFPSPIAADSGCSSAPVRKRPLMVRHLPNLLSALRLLAAPVAAWLILQGHDIAALLTFAAAGASDGLDGFIARRWGVTSAFGAWLDPVADKLLMLFCFTSLYCIDVTPRWLLV